MSCSQQVLIEDQLFRVLRPDETPDTKKDWAMVFVHGFLGNAQDTWTAPQARESFPCLLATDDQLTDYDVYLFQYPTKKLAPPSVDNIAVQLGFAVRQHLSHARVIFIAHSMGGLVCMRYILNLLAERQSQAMGGLLTYGTPMTGVEWAKYAQWLLGAGSLVKLPILGWISKLLRNNKQVEDLTTGGEFIEHLNGDWVLRVVNGGNAKEPADQRAWLPVRVVSGNDDWVVRESSAYGFYSRIDWENLNESHIELVKPANRECLSYQVAREFLLACRSRIHPQSLAKLRRQLDSIASLQQGKFIANWEFELSFGASEFTDGTNSFGLAGFCPFSVKRCSYRFLLKKSSVKFGIALGDIAGDAIWRKNDDLVFLHSLRLGALSVGQSDIIRRLLRGTFGDGARGWSRVFSDVSLRVRHSGKDSWHELEASSLEEESEGMVRCYKLPEEASGLIGQEIFIDIRFKGVLPVTVTDYTVWFPWLCDSFNARVTVDGSPSYFIDSKAMRGDPILRSKRDPQCEIEYSSEDLILPGSSISFEWGFENRRTA